MKTFLLKYWIEIVLGMIFILIISSCTPRYITVGDATSGKAKCGQQIRN